MFGIQPHDGPELQRHRWRTREAAEATQPALVVYPLPGAGELKAVLLVGLLTLLAMPLATTGGRQVLLSLAIVVVAGGLEVWRRPVESAAVAVYLMGFLFLWLIVSALAATPAVLSAGWSVLTNLEEVALRPGGLGFALVLAQLGGVVVVGLIAPLMQQAVGFEAVPTLRTLGLRVLPDGGKQSVRGWLLGAAVIGVAVACLWVGGWVAFRGVSEVAEEGAPIFWVAAYFALLVPAALCEEMVARGFVLQNLGLHVGPMTAVAGSAGLFAVLHLFNPNMGAIAWTTLMLSGLLFALVYSVTGSLWFCTGLHCAWNFVMGPLFGLRVSGLRMKGLLTSDVAGHGEVWSGGAFGPEGGLVVVICVSALIGAIAWAATKARRREAGGSSGADVNGHVGRERPLGDEASSGPLAGSTPADTPGSSAVP